MAMCLANGLQWEGVRFPEFDPSTLGGLITWYDFADHTFIDKASDTDVTFDTTSQDLYSIKNKWDSISTLPNTFPIDVNGNNPNGYFLGTELRSEGASTIPDWINSTGLAGGNISGRYVDFTGVYNEGGGTNNGSRRLKDIGGTSSTESISLDNFTFYIVFKQDVASPTSPDGGKQNLVWINGIKSSDDDESRLITLTKSGGAASGGGRYFLKLYVNGSLEASISAGSYTVDTSTKILGFIVNSSSASTSIGRMYQSGNGTPTTENTSDDGVATTMKGGEGAVSGDNICYIGSKGADISAQDPDNSFDGRMLEIVMYNRAIGTGEQSELETYFKTKWNI